MLTSQDVTARTNASIKAANVTGADAEDVSNDLTAVWNGFQISEDKTEQTVDKLAAVADTSASNLSQLATAMSKVASVANNMGVDVDQLNAQIATIIATTRQAPETVGNALKTIYTRINDIKTGSDEAQTSLGNYSSQMATLGVNVLDANGNLRDTGEVIQEIGNKWGSFSREQQVYLARTMAGQRQMNNLIALFDNWTTYNKELNVSLEASGTLEEKNNIYLESTAAHLQKLRTEADRTYDIMFDQDTVNGFIDVFDNLLTQFNNFIDGLGGGTQTITYFGSLVANVFNKQIAGGIQNAINNLKVWISNIKGSQMKKALAAEATQNINIATGQSDISSNALQMQKDMVEQMLTVQKGLTAQQQKQYNQLIANAGVIQTEIDRINSYAEDSRKYTSEISGGDSYIMQASDIEARIKDVQEERLKIQENMNLLQKQQDSLRQSDSKYSVQDLQNTAKALQSQKQSYVLTQEQESALRNISQLSGTQQAQQSDINILQGLARDLLDQQGNQVQQLNTLLQTRQAIDKGNLSTDKEILANLQKQELTLRDAGRSSIGLQKGVIGISVAAQAASAAVGTLPTLFDKTASASDKTLAATSGIGAAITAVGSAFGPIGMAVGMLGGAIVEAIGGAISKSQQKAEQAIEQVNQKWQDLSDSQSTFSSNIDTLNSLDDEFKSLSAGVSRYGENISLTADQYSRYQEIVSQVVGISPEVVKGYDAQGQAIVDNNDLIQKSIDLIKQKNRQQKKELTQGQDYTNTLQGASDDYKDTVSELQQYRDEFTSSGTILGQKLIPQISDWDGTGIENLQEYMNKFYGLFETDDGQRSLDKLVKNKDKFIEMATEINEGLTSNDEEAIFDVDELKQQLDDYAGKLDSLKDSQDRVNDQLLAWVQSSNETYKDYDSLDQQKQIALQDYISKLTLAPEAFENEESLEQAEGKLRKEISNYLDTLKSIPDQITDQLNSINPSDYGSEQDYVNALIPIAKKVSKDLVNNPDLGLDKSDANELVKKLLGLDQIGTDSNGDIKSITNEATTNAAKIVKQLRDQLGDKIPDDFNLLKYFTNDELSNASSAEDLGISLDNIESIKDDTLDINELLDTLKQKNALSQQASQAKDFSDQISTAKDVLETLTKGDQLSDKQIESLQALSSTIKANDELLKQYPELQGEAELLNQTWLSGSQGYKYALQDVIDKMRAYNVEQQNSSIQDQKKNLGIGKDQDDTLSFKAKLDTEDFDDQVNDLLEKDYTVTIEATVDPASQTLDDLTSEIDSAKDAAKSIGDGFVVANDDIEALSEAFPGILQGYKDLADGTIQLDQQTVQSALNASQAQIAADSDVTTTKVQNAISELQTKKSVYQGIADAANALAMSQGQSDDQVKQHKFDLQAQVNKLNGESSQNQETNANAVANNAYVNAQSIGTNYTAGYKQAAQAAYEFAQNAQNANDTAAGKATAKDYFSGTNFTGAPSSATTDVTIKDLSNQIKRGNNVTNNAAAIRDAALSAVSALDKQIGALTGKLAQNNSQLNDIGAGYNRVKSGKAYTQPKSTKSGSGNGGGSGKQAKSADEILKNLIQDSDIDRLHELDKVLEDIDKAIDKLDKDLKKTVRKGLSESINNEIAALEKEKGLYQKKIDATKEELALQKSILQQQGVQFDNQGRINNYSTTAIEYQKQYNSLLQQAATTQDATAQEAILNQADAYKQSYENLKKTMDSYEDLQDTIEDTQDKVNDLVDKQTELKIQQFKIKIEYTIETNQARRDFNDFRKELVQDFRRDDNLLGGARAAVANFGTYYNSQGTGDVQKLMQQVNATRRQAEIIEKGGTSSVYGRDQATALEDLKNYTDKLEDALKDVKSLEKQVYEDYLSSIDSLKDAMSDQIDAYEQMGDLLDHDKSMVQLLNGDDDYKDLEKYYDLTAKNNNQMIDFYRKQSQMWKTQMDNAEEGTKEWQKFRQNWMSSISDLNKTVESATKNLVDKYQNTINKIVKQSKNSLVGGDWEDMLDQWDVSKYLNDRYLDQLSSASGMLSFVDKVNEAMDGQNEKAQKQLKQLQDEQLKRLRTKQQQGKLTQTDLDISNKKLEVLQKQQALENAQNNKSKMRLRRDSQGNYTYQYVADEDDVNNKAEQLKQSIEDLRILIKKDVTDTIDEATQQINNFYEKAAELAEKYGNDTETLNEKLAELTDEYFGENGIVTLLGIDYNTNQQQLMNATGLQFANIIDQMGDKARAFLGIGEDAAGDSLWAAVQQLIGDGGKMPEIMDDFIHNKYQANFSQMESDMQDLLFNKDTSLMPSWNTALGNMASDMDNLTKNVVIPSYENMINANKTYHADLDELANAAGVDFGAIAQYAGAVYSDTQALININSSLIGVYQQEFNELQNVVSGLDQMAQSYANTAAQAIEAANAATQFWIAAMGGTVTASTPNYTTGAAASLNASTTSSGSGSGSGGSGTGGSSTSTNNRNSGSSGVRLDRKIGTQYSSSTSTYSPMYQEPTKYGGKIYVDYSRKTSNYDDIKKFPARNVTRFATGGYTGTWTDGDKDGRFAILHQKELVLNQDDTKNFLSAVKISSSILSSIAGMTNNAFKDLIAGRNVSNINTSTSGDSVQQSVVINASFPAANDVKTIQTALENLTLSAAQYANKNRRSK